MKNKRSSADNARRHCPGDPFGDDEPQCGDKNHYSYMLQQDA